MSPATVTIRDLKNKDTGIDLTIPTYKEIKGMLGSSYEYHVMVVSNLSYFKTAKHKESDNVQFMTPKKFADFEDLYTKMNTKYSGTAFPPLPKKVLLMNDSIAKERRGGLEYILKFLAMTPKLCTCPLLLEFLGVKAGRIKSMTVSDKGNTEESKQPETEEQEGILGTETQEPDQSGNLFDEEEEGPDEDNDMFSGVSSAREEDTVDTKIFEDQELGGAIEEGDDNLFLVDAKIDHGHSAETQQSDGEDNSDLFKIDDDLYRIMTLDLKPKTETFEEQSDHNKTEGTGEIMTSLKEKNAENIDAIPVNTKVNESITETDFDDIVAKAEAIEHVVERPKPAPRKKPTSKDKPNVPKRPEVVKDKPVVPKRPEIPKDKPNVPKRPEIAKDKPNLPKRPDIAAKPKVAEKPNIPSETDIDTSVGLEAIQDESDILKYIQENAANEDEVDLFL